MAKKLYEEASLQAIARSIRAKNGTAEQYTVAEMSAAIDDLQTATPGPTLLHEATVTASTTSTSAAALQSITISGLYQAAAAGRVLVVIEDTAGKRAGYFFRHEDYFCNPYAGDGKTTTITYGGRVGMFTNTDGTLGYYVGATTTAYGVYAYSITSAGVLQLRTRYSANYSKTIDGSYRVRVYDLGATI